MYIKKSIISGLVIVIGALVLLAVVIVCGFTEIRISKIVWALIWGGCVWSVNVILDEIYTWND